MKSLSLLLLIVTFVFFSACVQDTATTQSSSLTSTLPGAPSIEVSDDVDRTSPYCKEEAVIGWKCLDAQVTTSENKVYKITVKWNRHNMDSRGTVLLAVGGTGRGESREDPPQKAIIDQLDTIDQVRTVELDFMDPSNANPWGGGYFKHAGGYQSAAAAFKASVEFIISKGLIRGSFFNYYGGSNATMVAAYAMSKYDMADTFDRVIFQMGPFLPDLAAACDRNSSENFYLSNPEQQKLIFDLVNLWTFGDTDKNVCLNQVPDRVSILKGGVTSFPNTHVHVIVGAKEVTTGFGNWILASNLAWYKGITAKTKSRIIREDMSHNNSYQDMRRFMKLAPDQVPEEDPTCQDARGTFCNSSKKTVEWICRACGQIEAPSFGKWNNVGSNCFHRELSTSCNSCTQGTFCNQGTTIEWACECGVTGGGWVQVSSTCSHRRTTLTCK